MIGAGSSSLLRPQAVLIAGFALVVVVVGCGNTAYASSGTARNPDPAPSPARSLVQPDPYPFNRASSLRLAPATTSVRGSATPSEELAPHVVATGRGRAARKATTVRRAKASQPAHPATSTFLIPDHPAPRAVALAANPVETIRRVPVAVALAVASVVLLSGALLASISRAVTR